MVIDTVVFELTWLCSVSMSQASSVAPTSLLQQPQQLPHADSPASGLHPYKYLPSLIRAALLHHRAELLTAIALISHRPFSVIAPLL